MLNFKTVSLAPIAPKDASDQNPSLSALKDFLGFIVSDGSAMDNELSNYGRLGGDLIDDLTSAQDKALDSYGNGIDPVWSLAYENAWKKYAEVIDSEIAKSSDTEESLLDGFTSGVLTLKKLLG